MIEVPDHYCAALQTGLYVSLLDNGKFAVSPCPVASYSYELDSDTSFTHSPLKALRDDNKSKQELPAGCQPCMVCNAESNIAKGNTRGSFNSMYLKDELIYDQTGPKQITFQVDYTCKLACVACSPSLSTKWRAIERVKGIAAQCDKDGLRRLIRQLDLESLEQVHIFGGETLMTDTHEIILEELLAAGKTNLTVWYDLSATVLPNERTLELWEKFRLVRFKLSIDGVGKAFEFLRWPAVWNEVEDNILHLKETLPVNHMFSLRPIVGFLNFHIMHGFQDWYKQNLLTNRLGDVTEIEYNPVYGLFAYSGMTEEMAADADKLYPTDSPVRYVATQLTQDPTRIVRIKHRLEHLSQARNLDYAVSLPHLTKYLDGVTAATTERIIQKTTWLKQI